MLVLSRKLKETIHIGDNIIVTIVRVQGKSVRIGVQAPDQIRIRRGELPKADALVDDEDLSFGDPHDQSVTQPEPNTLLNPENNDGTYEKLALDDSCVAFEESSAPARPSRQASLQWLLARRQRRRTSVRLPR